MPFPKYTQPKYPRRCWAVEAYTGAGKSTFLTQLRGPILAIDADQRLEEVLPVARAAGNEVFRLSDDPTDALSPDAISRLLMANMPGSGIATIAVDTLTPSSLRRSCRPWWTRTSAARSHSSPPSATRPC